LVYICSPYSGDVEANIVLARRVSAFAVSARQIPLAPHLHYPQFMEKTAPDARELAMFFNRILLSKCEQLWAYIGRVSAGMRAEIGWAHQMDIPDPLLRCRLPGGAPRMTPFTLCAATSSGNAHNNHYPNHHQITDQAGLEQVARLDHVATTYTNDRRSSASFISSENLSWYFFSRLVFLSGVISGSVRIDSSSCFKLSMKGGSMTLWMFSGLV